MSVFRFSAAALMAVLCTIFLGAAHAATPTVTYDSHHDESRPMRDILAEQVNTPDQGSSESPYVVPNIFPKQSQAWQSEFIHGLAQRDIQDAPINVPAPTPSLSVLGLISGSSSQPGNAGTSIPPDTNGDVSPVHYIQWLNTRWAVFDRVTGRASRHPPQATRSGLALAAVARPATPAIRSHSGTIALDAG